MSSQVSQNPNITLSNIASKVTNQLIISKNKSSKKSFKTKKSSNSINKDVKVVYISNPIKFEVNADEFQALVQGLTGRDNADDNNNNNNNDNNNNSARDLSNDDEGVHQDEIMDEVQQEPLMDDDQGQMDGYDGTCYNEIMSPDYYGAFDGCVLDENKGQISNNNIIYGDFPSFYD